MLIKPDIFFSVVIPVFNGAEKISAALDSLKAQTFKDFEVIVVDDHSDDFDVLVEKVRESGLENIKLIRQPHRTNGGAARNVGIETATGCYICFLDADDYWFPEKLEVAVRRISMDGGENLCLYHRLRCEYPDGKMFFYPPRGIKPGESVAQYLFVRSGLMQTSTLICSAALLKSCRFPAELERHQDWDFVLNLEQAGAAFVYLDETLGVWNVRPSRGRAKRDSYAKSARWVRERRDRFDKTAEMGFRINVLAYRLFQDRKFFSLFWLLTGSLLSRPLICLEVAALTVERITLKISAK